MRRCAAKPSAPLLALVAAAAAAIVAALFVGSFDAPAADVLAALAGKRSSPLAAVVLDLRLPRALSAFAVGGLLALAGAILQALLRNPLADPYVLGVSGGAALAAGAGLATMQAASAVGALATLALLFLLARRAFFTRDALRGESSTTGVLLTGVMIAAFAAAILSLALTLATDTQLRTMVFWLLGDLAGATDLRMAFVALALLPAAAVAGGLLVVVADTAARTVAAPVQLPVGVVTALVGVPVFLWLLRRV
ncbi:MAG: FecCD family ABC transporter permease [Burkholderiaceae bacterium]